MFGIKKNEKTQCQALNKKGDHCSKYSILLSRYCIYHQEIKTFISTAIIGFVVSIIAIITWEGGQYLREESIIESIRPEVSVKIKELREDRLHFSIEMINNDGNYVDEFFFDFEIPGEIINITRELLQNVGNAVVDIWPDDNKGMLVKSEYALIRISRLYPKGFYDFFVDYIPTEITEEKPNDNNPRRALYIDIPDYQPVSYYWTYKGITHKELYYLDLTDLNFIKKHNEALINFKQRFSDQEYYTPEYHKNWEMDRMHITNKALIKKY